MIACDFLCALMDFLQKTVKLKQLSVSSCGSQKRSKEAFIMHKTCMFIIYHKHSNRCDYNTFSSLIRLHSRLYVKPFGWVFTFDLRHSNLDFVKLNVVFNLTGSLDLFHPNALLIPFFDLYLDFSKCMSAEGIERFSVDRIPSASR